MEGFKQCRRCTMDFMLCYPAEDCTGRSGAEKSVYHKSAPLSVTGETMKRSLRTQAEISAETRTRERKVETLYGHGLRDPDIAEEMGITPVAVMNIRRRIGLVGDREKPQPFRETDRDVLRRQRMYGDSKYEDVRLKA